MPQNWSNRHCGVGVVRVGEGERIVAVKVDVYGMFPVRLAFLIYDSL